MEEIIEKRETPAAPPAWIWLFWGCLAAVAGALFLPALLLVPAILVFAAYRTKAWSLLLFAVLALGAGAARCLYLVESIYPLLLVLIPTLALYALQKYRFGNFLCTFYGSIIFFAVFFGVVCLPSMIAGGGMYGHVTPWAERMLSWAREGLGQLILFDPANARFYREYLSALPPAKELVQLLLPVLYAVAALCALSNTLFMHALNGRKKRAELCPLHKFGTWRCPRPILHALLGLLVVSVILMFLELDGATAFIGIAQLLFLLPTGLVGLSMLWHMTDKKRWLFVVFCVGLALLPSFVLYLLSFLAILGSSRRPIEPPKGDPS
ncbi:MAG: DUF2232 domain-containing protein [Clostridiales bacterium]|nr:DUF2232 domain-containing protein [Clostridiales bacterium]